MNDSMFVDTDDVISRIEHITSNSELFFNLNDTFSIEALSTLVFSRRAIKQLQDRVETYRREMAILRAAAEAELDDWK